MKEQLISFQVAKLAKEKGFGLGKNNYCQTLYYYNTKGVLNNIEDNIFKRNIKTTHLGAMTMDDVEVGISLMDNSLDEFSLAPTQSLLQKWLREIHKIFVFVEPTLGENNQEFAVYATNNNQEDLNLKLGYESSYHVKTYEEALEKGLYQALLLI